MRYRAPATVDEAVALLAAANGDARVLAGGTDLVVQLRSGRLAVGLVVDVKRIPELRAIAAEDGGFRIGAAVSGAEIGEHEGLKRAWPGVVEAATLIGSTQIQGRATLGGNLCNASPAADSVPALICAGATCVVAGPKGRRELPVEEIAVAPGRTSLGPGELVVAFRLPPRPAHAGDAYLRLIPRTEMDIAVVGAGVSLRLDKSGKVAAARVTLGAVAARALVVAPAAEALVGSRLEREALERLGAAAAAACRPIDDKRGTIAYRIRVAGVLARRAALRAHERAEKA